MKKEYAKYIKDKFKQIIPERFSCYRFKGMQHDFGLDYNFICEDDKSFKMISIQNSHDENAFTIELFWSNDGSKVQHDLSFFWFEKGDNVLETMCHETTNSLRIRLSDFYAQKFDSWWAIDPTGKIIESIKKHGYITSSAYNRFYSKDTFLSDETFLEPEEYAKYIDPLIENAVELLEKYALPLFKCLDEK